MSQYSLDHSISVKVSLSTRVCSEHEGSDIVLYSLALHILLGLSNPGYFWMSVHYGWDSAIVDVAITLFDILDCSNTFFFSLLSQ